MTPDSPADSAAEDAAFGGWRACDVCGEPIDATSDATLVLRGNVLEERRATLATNDAPGEAERGLVAWDWGHRECCEALAPLYIIEGDRMDTLPRLMARTLQLLDEDWFLETAWEDAVRRFSRVPYE